MPKGSQRLPSGAHDQRLTGGTGDRILCLRGIRESELAKALVIGESGGIGGALVQALRDRGDAVTGLSRRKDGLDVTDPASVSAIFGALEGPYELILLATGILAPKGCSPEKSLAAVDPGIMAEVMAVNAIGPALVLREVPRLLPRRGRSVVAVLTARVGSIGDNRLGGWYGYRASKAAANQIVRTAAIEIGRRWKEAVVVALHPGTVATPFTKDYSARERQEPADAARKLLAVLDGLTVEQSGSFFDHEGLEVPW